MSDFLYEFKKKPPFVGTPDLDNPYIQAQLKARDSGASPRNLRARFRGEAPESARKQSSEQSNPNVVWDWTHNRLTSLTVPPIKVTPLQAILRNKP